MIFANKRNRGPDTSSNKEKLLSILGFILACGLIGGLGALIYGLVKRIPSGIIGGAVVTGVSILLIALLLLIFFFCLKNTDTNAHTSGPDASARPGHRKARPHQRQHRQYNQERTTSHEITVISGNQRLEQQPQRPAHQQHISIEAERASMHTGLTDSANHGHPKQSPLSPSMKTATFAYLNQSHGSTTHPQQASTTTSDTK